jgi:endonuclease/exonuclease/phosphatase family metal-dependent hydrolase
MLRLYLVGALILGACGDPSGSGGDPVDAAVPQPDGYPAPRGDLVDPVGSDDSLDIATWNIENFPQFDNTARIAADLIVSLGLDLVAVQEIADIDSFNELDARLPDHQGILSVHTYGNGSYQKVGYLYRADLMTITDQVLLFLDEGYVFPRPPLQVTVTVEGADPPVDFIAIVVHLKAGGSFEDQDRRDRAVDLLAAHVEQLVAEVDRDVIILGDFNEITTDSDGQEVLGPFLSSAAYRFRSQALAEAGEFSFVPSERLIDHIITTVALDDEFGGATVVIPRLDQDVAGYLSVVSDHLPVVIQMPIF